MNRIKLVILVIAGNDYGSRGPGGLSEVVVSNVHMINWCGYAVEWMISELPNTVIATMDIIPRLSKNNVFANGVKELSDTTTCVNETYHRHATTWMIFSFEIYSESLETDGHCECFVEHHERDTKQLKQYGIRRQLFADDGVHLNRRGKKLLAAIITWLKDDSPDRYLRLNVNENYSCKGAPRAFIKF